MKSNDKNANATTGGTDLLQKLTHMSTRKKIGACPTCECSDAGATLADADSLSLREFKISGLCATCQKEMFR